jgi:hypothetical protein
MSVEQIIKDKVVELAEGGIYKVYVAPNIDDKKRKNASLYITNGIEPSEIIAVVDMTLFGSAKEGFVFTANNFYYQGPLSSPEVIPYEKIHNIEYCESEVWEKGKIKTNKDFIIYDSNNNELYKDNLSSINFDKFCDLLNLIIKEIGGEVKINCHHKKLEKHNETKNDPHLDQIKNIIKNKVSEFGGELGKVYLSPSVDAKKFENASRYIAYGRNPNEIIAIVDTTLFGSAKEGFVFTAENLYCKSFLDHPISVSYESIYKVEYKEKIRDEEGNIKDDSTVIVLDSNNNELLKESGSFDKCDKLCCLLYSIIIERGSEVEIDSQILLKWGNEAKEVKEAIEKNRSKYNQSKKDDPPSGFLDGVLNLAKKGIDAYGDAQEKEMEIMKDWPDNRLADTVQKKQLLPAGIAAKKILNERGYSDSQIMNM